MPQTNEENLKAARMLKAEGNEHFKAANLKDAATCYKHMNLYLRHLDSSKGDKMGGMGKMMGGDKQDAMKNKKYKVAVKEATNVLERQPENAKALFNRAKANCMLGHTDASREDVIKCDQSDSQVKAIVQRVEALEKKALTKQR